MNEQLMEFMTYIDDISDELTSGVYKNIADRLMKMKSTSDENELKIRLLKLIKEQNDFYKELVKEQNALLEVKHQALLKSMR